jgi:Family of unknown function (DUF6077)
VRSERLTRGYIDCVGATARWGDRALDGVLLLLATWTPVYHLSLLLSLGTAWALTLEVVALGLVSFVLLRHPESPTPDTGALVVAPETGGDRRLVVSVVVAAVVAAAAMAVRAPWVLVWVPWLVAASLGTWWGLRRLRLPNRGVEPQPDASQRSDSETVSTLEAGVAWTWAVGLGALSLFLRRPNPDDLFYLNVSQWVATHGTFPVRDTLFSDLRYPMANWPPVASYDAMAGVVARLGHAHAATVEYELVLPVATGLSVLALWRLLRIWRTPARVLALSAALLFLLVDGTTSYGSPGNLFLTRLWQGKVILLCLAVPLLLGYAARFAERPDRRRALWLLAASSAAVGLSTTAMFLLPVIAVATAVPLLRRTPRQALVCFAAVAAYPMAAGVVTLVLGGRSADDFAERRLYRFDAEWIGHTIFLDGTLALVAVLAVLLGALLVPHSRARVTTGVLVLATGAVLVPGATSLGFNAVGLGPTLWRVSFGATVAALVGVGAARAWTELARRMRWSRAAPVALLVVVAVAVTGGAPIWSPDTGARWQAPLHWQRSDSSRAVAEWAIAAAGPEGRVLAPDGLAITVAITTTAVKTVAPRDYYMEYLRDDPTFHHEARSLLVDIVNDERPWDDQEATDALDLLDVRVVCVNPWDGHLVTALIRSGFREKGGLPYYRCVQR